MIRFIDLSEAYWTDPEEGSPICAFLSTTSDIFLTNGDVEQTFSSLKEIEEHPDAERLISLMPDGFFKRVNGMNKYRFHWRSGPPSEGYGRDVAAAFTKLGYGAGALATLDYTEMIS